MADGGVEVPATNLEQEQMAEVQQHSENPQSTHHEQHEQEEHHEQEEQNGVTSDVPVPGTEPAAPLTPGECRNLGSRPSKSNPFLLCKVVFD